MTASTAVPQWQVTRGMYGSVIESHRLPDDSDVQRSFAALMLEWKDAGWHIGEFSTHSGIFFRDAERRMVSIDSHDPYDASMNGSHFPNGMILMPDFS